VDRPYALLEDPVQNTDEIIALARSRSPEDRERLLMALADLCDGDDQLTPAGREVVETIFMDLVVQAERDIRQRLAEKLAASAWAPHALISILALDDIEIARPVIARSPVLKDADLIRLLVEATLEHQIEVARRPEIGAPVVSAILDQGQPAVMTALAANDTAQVTPLHMHRLVIASRRIAALRGALARHPKLTDNLAHTLYSWVGDALRANIAERFTIDEARLEESLSEAVKEVMDGPPDPELNPTPESVRLEQEEMERRLIAKLKAAGQLRPGYLLRALREGRRSLFEHALTDLGAYPPGSVAAAIHANRADLLALACHGVGIDRSVFPHILSLVQALNSGRPTSGDPTIAQAQAEAFKLDQDEAAAAFREAVPTI
jgi:uncharacterized protein (DUF2336 family)